MLPNGFITIKHFANGFSSSYRRFAAFNNYKRTAMQILSEFDVKCFRKYGCLPFVTSQVVTDGVIDTYKYFVTFPKPSTSYYMLQFAVINDLPF
jgi:hypothetical protein